MASVAELYHHDLASGATTKVDLQWDNGLSFEFDDSGFLSGFHVTNDGFLALLANGVRNKTARYQRIGDKWERQWLSGDHTANLIGMQVAATTKCSSTGIQQPARRRNGSVLASTAAGSPIRCS